MRAEPAANGPWARCSIPGTRTRAPRPAAASSGSSPTARRAGSSWPRGRVSPTRRTSAAWECTS
eukprot:10150482-Alexandrium_andersonii.AAC.1